MLKTNKNLFKLLDTFERQNPEPKEIGNINYRLFYSELLNEKLQQEQEDEKNYKELRERINNYRKKKNYDENK